MELLHKELTYKLKGCFYDVQNELGLGYDEESYHLALEERLKIEGISFQSKVEKYIEHIKTKVHQFIIDLIIQDKVILELKNIQTDFHKMHYVQLFGYLKCWQKDLGLLVNFGTPSVNDKRLAFTEKVPIIKENYTELNGLLSKSIQNHLKSIREAILTILKLHGLGYKNSIYKKILQAELNYLNIPFVPQITIPLKFREKNIRNFELKIPVITNCILCNIIALEEDIKTDIKKTRTYLQDANLPFGL